MSDTDVLARTGLHRIATHVLARARFAAAGRVGLRIVPSGIATPAFGPDAEVLRLSPTHLVREGTVGGVARTATRPLGGSSLAQLIALAEVDLSQPFSAGHDTVALGDVEESIELDQRAASRLLAWLHLGAVALDAVLGIAQEPSIVQLWPEHFDLAVDVATRGGRANLGCSPGDAEHPVPYLYVGPWGPERPGDPGYWNAAFGAVLDAGDVLDAPDPPAAATAFFRHGLDLLS